MRPTARQICKVFIVITAVSWICGCAAQPMPTGSAAVPAAAEGSAAAHGLVVAKVNSTELFMDALVAMLNRLPGKGGSAPETMDERKQGALDSLVLLELAYQRAVASGLAVDPVKVEVAFNTLKENVGGEREFADYLHRQAKTESALRAEIERGFAIELIYTKEVVDRVVVPEEELWKEYEKDRHQFLQPEKVSVIDVHVITNNGGSSGEKAEELLRAIKAERTMDPWKLVLDNTFLVRKLVVSQDRDKELYDAAITMKPGELSGVVRTATGVHIIKLESYSPERLPAFDDVKPKLIAKLKGPYQEKRTREWEQELKAGAIIKTHDLSTL